MSKSQQEPALGPPQCFYFFSASATLKFISKVVQQITKYKGESDRSCAAGGHCDLASMCSDALRAHLLWDSRGGGARPGIYLCLKANWQPKRKMQAHHLRDIAGQTPWTAAEKCQLSAPPLPQGFEHPQRCVWKRLHLQSEAGVKALPSAMRCSGTCRITRTERLQER